MASTSLIDSAFALRLTSTFLHFLWQGTVIALLATLVAQLLVRSSARARYQVQLGALILMAISVSTTFVLLPLDGAVRTGGESGVLEIPAGAVDARDFESPPAAVPIDGLAGLSSSSGGVSNEAVDQTASELPTRSGAAVALRSTPAESPSRVEADSDFSRHTLLVRWARWVALVYFLGVIVLSLRLLHGTRGSLRLRRSSTEVAVANLVDRIRCQAVRLGMRTIPLLRSSAEISVPVVIGFIRPLILLPTSALTGLSIDQLEAVVAHEMAHIRRYDLVANMFQRVIEALLFFHPAVWWVSRQVSNERERACDELVLSAGFGRTQYADALVRMAEVCCCQGGGKVAALTTGLAADGSTPTEFKRRILEILGIPQTSDLLPGRWAMIGAVAFILFTATAPGVWIHFVATAAAQQVADTEVDDTMAYLRSLRPDSMVADPRAKGRELAESDIAAGKLRILYCGKPWSAGKPLVDDETGYEVVITNGCSITAEFVVLVDAYNEVMREHGRQKVSHTTIGNGLKLVFSPDGQRLAVMNGNPTRTMFRDGRSVAKGWKPTVEILDTTTEKVFGRIDLSDLPSDPDRPFDRGPTFVEATAIAFSPDSRLIAVGTSVGQLKLFDVASGTLLKSFDDQQGRLAEQKIPEPWSQMPRAIGRVKSLAFSADGKSIAVCGDSFADWIGTLDRVDRGGLSQTAAGRLKVFDVATGDLKFNPLAHSNLVVDVAYSPDGRFLASAGRWMDSLEQRAFGDGIVLWDAQTGERLGRINLELRGWMYDIEFSSDSNRILVGAQDFDSGGGNGTGVAAMLSSEPLAVLWKRPIKRSAMVVAFNPQQEAVIVLTNRESLSYLDAGTGKTQLVLNVADPDPAKKQLCEHFAISPQGHLLATGLVEQGTGRVKYLRIGKLQPDETKKNDHTHPVDGKETQDGSRPSGAADSHPADEPSSTDVDTAAQASDIKVGMTFDEVVRIKGKHYRPVIGMGEGQLFMTYDDITVGVKNYSAGAGNGRVWRIDPTPPDIDELVGNVPYADTVKSGDASPQDRATRKPSDVPSQSSETSPSAGSSDQAVPDLLWKPEFGISGYLRDDGTLEVSIQRSERAPARFKDIVTLPRVTKLRLDLSVPIAAESLQVLSKLNDLQTLELTNGESPQFQPGRADLVLSIIKDLPALRELSLNETGATDAGFAHLAGNTRLESLSVYQDGGIGNASIEIISDWKQLKSLSFVQYVFVKGFPRMAYSADSLRKLSSLKSLMHLSLIGFDVPPEVIAHAGLKLLSISGPSINDEAAIRIARCADLQSLTLSGTKVSDAGLRIIAEGTELQKLTLDRNSEITDLGISYLQRMPLRHIELRGNALSDKSFEYLARITTLSRIDITGSRQLAGPEGIGSSAITRRLTIEGMRALKDLPELRTLWIMGFPSNAHYAALAELKQLRELVLTMALTEQRDLEFLETALPNTSIVATTGGGLVGGVRPRHAHPQGKDVTRPSGPDSPRPGLEPASPDEPVEPARTRTIDGTPPSDDAPTDSTNPQEVASEPPIVTVLGQPVTLSLITYKSITADDVAAKRRELTAADFQKWLYETQSLNLLKRISSIIMQDYQKHAELRPTQDEIASELSAFVQRHPSLLDEKHKQETALAVGWTVGSSMDWVLAKHLHERHGGRLAISSFGAFTAIDGRNAVLEEYADAGKIMFHDREYESLFWQRTKDPAVLDVTISDQKRIKQRLTAGPWQSWMQQKESQFTERLKLGMSLEEVLSIKGRHYRLLVDGPDDAHLLVYDDVGVCMTPDPNNPGARRVEQFYTRELAEFAGRFPARLADVPYADADTTADERPSKDGID